MENSEYVKSGKAAYLVAVLFIVLALMFSGCNETNPVGLYKVHNCRQWGNNYCRYELRPLSGEEDLFIKDTCGLYNVGDTLWFKNLSDTLK